MLYTMYLFNVNSKHLVPYIPMAKARGLTAYIDKGVRKAIRVKAMAYLNMVEHGVLHSPLNITETKAKLLEKKNS